MNCKDVKELILTDYADGQLDQARTQELENHLLICRQCNELAATVKSKLIEPMGCWEKPEVPESIWLNIKDTIQSENQTQKAIEKPTVFELLEGILRVFKPRYMVVCVSMILIVSALLSQQKSEVIQVAEMSGENQAQQIEFMRRLVVENVDSLEDESENYGEAIEEYFLLSKK